MKWGECVSGSVGFQPIFDVVYSGMDDGVQGRRDWEAGTKVGVKRLGSGIDDLGFFDATFDNGSAKCRKFRSNIDECFWWSAKG